MPNEVLWFIFALINFGLMLGVYKLFGKTGMFVWIGIGTVLANIQVTKTIELFSIDATLGNIMYGTIFLATDCLNEKYGKKDGLKGVLFGLVALFGTFIIMHIVLQFTPSSSDLSQSSLVTIFGFLPRIAIGSLVAYLVSQTLDVLLFAKIKEKLPSTKHLYIRNNVSTLISQLIDTFIFVPIAFYGIYSNDVFWNILLTTYIIKAIVALLDTPFIYLLKKIKPIKYFNEEEFQD